MDPYGGGSSIDPYGGHDPDDVSMSRAEAEVAAADAAPDKLNQNRRSWRTWRIKGAFDAWGSLPRILGYLGPYKRLYVAVFILTFLEAVIALAEPWPLAVILDSVLTNPPKPPGLGLSHIFGSDPNVYTLLIFVVAAGFMITIIGQGLQVIEGYVSAKMEQNMVLDLRSQLFQHVQKLSLSFHDERFTGQLMSIINLQASAVGAVVMAFPPIVQNFLTLIGMLIIALLIDWQVTLISLVAVPMIYYASGLYGTRIVPRIRQVMGLEWRSLSIVFEAMQMLRVIVSFGREKYEHRRFRDQAQTAVDARVKLTVRQTVFGLGVAAATALGTALVLGFGAWHVLRGDITIGQLTVLIAYIAAVYQPLEQIGTQIGHLHQQFVFVNAAIALLDDAPEVEDRPDAVDLGRAQGHIKVEDVSFAYHNRVDTLKNINFDIKAGERVAVVGPTGAGKTTLVNLLVRFYEPKEGKILLDGIDVRDIRLKSLRDNIGLVLQQPMLFSGTIAENVRYGRLDATMDDVMAACKKANAHEFVMALPKGYQTELGEGGMQLSGGERQRLCVARAFVKDAPILILDEPTSSIDSKTENVILEALDELMVGRTSFMIAHRLSTIHDADRILVVNHGELVEQGTHEELVARGGLFAQLWEAQTRQKARRTVGVEPQARPEVPAGVGPPEPAEQPQPVASEPAPPPVPGEAPDVRERVAAAVADAHRTHPPAAPVNGDQVEQDNGKNGRRTVRKIHAQSVVHCDVCGRTLLKGEMAGAFLAPPGGKQKEQGLNDMAELDGPFLTDFRRIGQTERMLVCELCWPLAEEQGWTALPAIGGT
jgi:ATP-binding cassette, subfamily B, bacterial